MNRDNLKYEIDLNEIIARRKYGVESEEFEFAQHLSKLVFEETVNTFLRIVDDMFSYHCQSTGVAFDSEKREELYIKLIPLIDERFSENGDLEGEFWSGYAGDSASKIIEYLYHLNKLDDRVVSVVYRTLQEMK